GVPVAGVVVAVPVPCCGETVVVAGCPVVGSCAPAAPAVPVPAPTGEGFPAANADVNIANTAAATTSIRRIVMHSPFGIVNAGLDHVIATPMPEAGRRKTAVYVNPACCRAIGTRHGVRPWT